MSVSIRVRREVIARAGNRCEYCGLAQAGQEATFHIDHIVPLVASGVDEQENLALACVSCSLRKGARQLAVDPATSEEIALSIREASVGRSIFAGTEYAWSV